MTLKTAAQEIADTTIARWQAGDAPDAQTLLDSHPDVEWSLSVFCDLVYEEYLLRKQRGEKIDRESFASKFGERSAEVVRLLEVDSVFSFSEAGDTAAKTGWGEFPQIGDCIGDALLLDQLGEGSVGRVYLASRKEMGDKQFAVKVSYRLPHEADLLGRVNHPNIMPVSHVEYDKSTGRRSVFMPFRGRATMLSVLRQAFDGVAARRGSLICDVAQSAIKAGDVVDESATPRPPHLSGSYTDAVLSVFSRIADALEHAHQKGVVHSDLKPSNILIDTTGSPLLLDFNLSFRDDLREGAVGGTFAYMPPESIRAAFLTSEDDRSDRVDVFSFGAVLYHMLCGATPFDIEQRPDPAAEAWAGRSVTTIEQGPLRIQRDLMHVHPVVVALIRRCLASDPQQRPAMSEVAAELRRYFRPLHRVRRSKRLRVVLALAAAASILLGTVLASRPPYVDRQISAGVAAAEQGDWEMARDHFENVVAAEPKNHVAYYRLARVHVQLGDLQAAEEAMDEATLLAKDNGEYLAYHAHVLALSGQYADARADYLNAIDADYTTIGTYNNLGYLYIKSAELLLAEKWLSRAIEDNPSIPQPYLNRADMAIKLAEAGRAYDLPRALADIEQAIELAPDSALAAHEAARLYGLAAERDAAAVTSALRFLRVALVLGLDPAAFAIDVDPFLSELRRDPRYAAVRSVEPRETYVMTDRMVDPTRDFSGAGDN